MKYHRTTNTVALIALASVMGAGEQNAAPAAEKEKAEKPVFTPPPAPKLIATETLGTKDLCLKAGIQARVSFNQETADEYTEKLKQALAEQQPNPFPPGKAVRAPDGKIFPYDGLHRLDAHKRNKVDMEFELYETPEGWEASRYAQFLAFGANAEHGLKRTNKDKQFAVKTAIQLFPEASNMDVARMTNVSEKMVRDWRPAKASASAVRTVTRKGKTVKMDTSRIGTKGGKKAKASAASKKGGKSEETGKNGAAAGQTNSVKEQKLRAAIVKIAGAQPNDKQIAAVRTALEEGTLDLSAKDIETWANTSPERIRQITPLVVDKQFKPERAFKIIDKELEDKSSLADLAMVLLTSPKKRVDLVGGLRIVTEGDTMTITLDKKS